MRMHMRRFARLTNAFSKKFENHVHMVALYTVFYNFTKIHKTLRVTRNLAVGDEVQPVRSGMPLPRAKGTTLFALVRDPWRYGIRLATPGMTLQSLSASCH
jgi:hypothetical protein